MFHKMRKINKILYYYNNHVKAIYVITLTKLSTLARPQLS